MAFANPFALSLRQAHLQRTGFRKTKQVDHGEHYSGWQPKIPRVNHLDPVERVAHMHNVESRRRRQQLIDHMNQIKADIRGENEKQSGPGVSADALERWSRTQNLAHPHVEPAKKQMIQNDLAFIQRSKEQMRIMKRDKQLPLPHVASRNPTWKQMHRETMERSFSALARLELTSEDVKSVGADTVESPRDVSETSGDAVPETDRGAAGVAESAFRKSVTFAATTTDSIDRFWEEREADLFS